MSGPDSEAHRPAGDWDVIVVGGGPAGSTVGSLLRKYNPHLNVLILEKAKFPRDHIGESQLPAISAVLNEMGAWDKVEAAGFPVKIGASYTWGRSRDRWEFDFYRVELWKDEERPAKYEGQRRYTAFQVDRAIYDDVLLRHAESMGCEVREETYVRDVDVEGERISSITLNTGEALRAKHFVDASGNWAVLRKALGVSTDVTSELKNIAIWDYWENAEWAVEIGVGTTRVQIRSLPYGWIWFIPMGPTRTSIGFICPSEHFASSGLSKEEMYHKALREEPDISRLIRNAKPRGRVEACKDWSHLADQLAGENWFLVGEAAGFADPILAAGMTLAHSSARDCAYTILELERGEHDAAWLRSRYDEANRTNIRQHIRFAKFWYAANGCFTDIREHCQQIARDAGLRLSPTDAWRWLSQGGLTHQNLTAPSVGTFDLASAKNLINRFHDGTQKTPRIFEDGYNVFQLNLKGARKRKIGRLANGRIEQVDCYFRNERRLPIIGHFYTVIKALEHESDLSRLMDLLRRAYGSMPDATSASIDINLSQALQALEHMVEDLWVTRRRNPKRPVLEHTGKGFIRSAEDARSAIEQAPDAPVVKYNV